MRWSETGDRYIVSLFRDYVFHQVDEAGNPVVNLTHVITCLNKVRVLVRPNMVVFIDPSLGRSIGTPLGIWLALVMTLTLMLPLACFPGCSWMQGRMSGLCWCRGTSRRALW